MSGSGFQGHFSSERTCVHQCDLCIDDSHNPYNGQLLTYDWGHRACGFFSSRGLYCDEFATSWINGDGKNLGLTVQILTDLLDMETG